MNKLIPTLCLLPALICAQDVADLDALQGKTDSKPFTVAEYKAALDSLLPGLSKDRVEERHETQQIVQNIGSHAGRPGAEAERRAFSKAALAAMTSASQPAKVWLVRQLEVVGGNESVAALSELALDSDRELRDVARRALQMNPSEDATKALVAALRKAKNHEITTGLIYALGERKTEIAVSAIALYLGNENYYVASAAAIALGRIATDAAVEALIVHHKKNPSSATADALLAAAEFAQAANQSRIIDVLSGKDAPDSVQIALLKTLVKYGHKKATPKLKEALASNNADLIGAAGQLLSEQSREELIAQLAKDLGNYSTYAQEQILQAVGAKQVQSATAAAAKALTNNSSAVRAAAIAALGQIGSSDSIQALLDFSNSAESDDQRAIKQALWRTAGDGVNEVIAKAAANGQVAALQASIDRAIYEVAPQLIAQYHQLPQQAQGVAAKALQTLAGDGQLQDVLGMLSAESESLRKTGESVLSALGMRAKDKDGGVAAIKKAYAKADERAKQSMLAALRGFGTDEALALVTQEISSNSEALQEAAVRSLAAWNQPQAVSVLLKLSRDDSAPLNYRVLALRGVNRLIVSSKELDAKQKIEGLLEALGSANRPEEKNLALSSLAQINAPEAFTVFEDLLDDASIRNSAAMSALRHAENMSRKKRKEARALANKIKDMNISDAISRQADKALSKIR